MNTLGGTLVLFVLFVGFLFFVMSFIISLLSNIREKLPQQLSGVRSLNLYRGYSKEDETISTVCVVIRSHERQVYDSVYPLGKMLEQFTTVPGSDKDIAIILLPTDSTEPTGMRFLYEHYKHRINISLVELQNRPSPRIHGHLGIFRERHNLNFHNIVYRMTDDAIGKCPENFRWLLITNGDNSYMPAFFDQLDDKFDIVAFDFYTRHYYYNSGLPVSNRSFVENCRRLVGSSHRESSCLSNNLSFAHTDLGANVLNLKKYRYEQRLYDDVIADERGVSKDGYMMMNLVSSGWKVKHVRKHDSGCLYSHNPNYQSCINHSILSLWEGSTEHCILSRSLKNLDLLKKNALPAEYQVLERCVSKVNF